MIVTSFLRLTLIGTLSLVSVATIAAEKKEKIPFIIGYVMLEDDGYYKPKRAYAGLQLKTPKRPLIGVKLGIRESRVPTRALDIRFSIDEIVVKSPDKVIAAIEQRLTTDNLTALVLDLPFALFSRVIQHKPFAKLLLFNARLRNNELRRDRCHTHVFHTIPSHAMLHDALAQFLKSKRWTRILVLAGELAEDQALAQSFSRSATKVGLKIVEQKQFLLSNDPRNRSETNIPIMTSGPKHDVVFVADSFGEFSRYIPYQTYHSKVIVGSEGLIPTGWHWTWERHGAPQLNQRFERLSDNKMSEPEWAGWAAVKALTVAVVNTQRTNQNSLKDFFNANNQSLDLYKGAPGGFRRWNQQLRQPILFATHNATIERAPITGFLHRINDLDTLGLDDREVPADKCNL